MAHTARNQDNPRPCQDPRGLWDGRSRGRSRFAVLCLSLLLALGAVLMLPSYLVGGQGGSLTDVNRDTTLANDDANSAESPSDHVDDAALPESSLSGPMPPVTVSLRNAIPSHPVTVNIAAIGDVLMHVRVTESGKVDGGYDFTHLFAHVAPAMAAADIRVLNQETPIAGAAFPYAGYPMFNSPFEVADAEVAAGFNLALKATNHVFDIGYEGVDEELGLWASRHPETKVIGATRQDAGGVSPVGGISPAGPAIFTKDGFRVAVLNYTDVLNLSVDPSRDSQMVGFASEERVRADVDWARTAGRADAIVVFMHWGEEYVETPAADEHALADLFLKLGIDAVIGSHPHVLQPVEVMERADGHKMVVFWSMGNFVSTQTNNRNMIGLIASVSLTKDAEGTRVSAYEATPLVTHRAYGREFTTYLLRDYTDDLARVNQVRQTDSEGITVEWCQRYCQRVLGDGYDRERGSLRAEVP